MPRLSVTFLAAFLLGLRVAAATPPPAGPAAASSVTSFPRAGSALEFRPVFTVLYSAQDPGIEMRPAGVTGVPYNCPTWKVAPEKSSRLQIKRNAAQGGDGFDTRILDGPMQNRAHDLYAAGESVVTLTADGSSALADGGVRYTFPQHPQVTLTAEWRADPVTGFSRLTVHAERKTAGYLSIGYTGAPAVREADAQEGWQPLIWTERRFPSLPYLTSGHMATLPGAFLRTGGVSYGVIADPAEMPYQPLPLFKNVRFGVALRAADGTLQPAVFAPMLGGARSKGAAGETLTFTYRLIAESADIPHAFEAVARRLYGFGDRRHNALGSLNSALGNLLSYAKSDYGWFVDDLKGCAYSTDVPGAVKNVSALNPLGLALVTDDAFLFDRRAKPLLEYLLSREKFLFSLDPKQKVQSPSRLLKGPCAPLSEMTAWAGITDHASPVYLDTARELFGRTRVLNLDDPSPGGTWWNALALYRATGDAAWLARARTGADAYLAHRLAQPSDRFVDPEGMGFFFWTGFTPRWVDLLMLHEATQDARYLWAAHQAARLYTLFIWMCPAVPDTDIRVNEGGQAPVYWYLGSRGFPPIRVPEESAPAWRLSEIGLTAESSGTASGHRGILMANYAPWMLRLAALTGDDFLHDIARWAVIGRYRSFPGYHINTARTTVYEKADYPLRPHDQLSYNSLHYNHILPMGTMLLDYLVSDAWARSAGAVDFPSDYIEGYAYLQSRFYGHRPGRIYDLKGLQLWMPDGLVQPESPELNAVSAYNADGVAVVLTNQSDQAVTTHVRLNARHFSRPVGGSTVIKRWSDNRPVADALWVDGGVTIEVPARGIAAFFAPGAVPRLEFRSQFQPGAQGNGAVVAAQPGDARAMLLSIGPARTWAYVYLREDDSRWTSVRLQARVGDHTHDLVDHAFPYEFDFPVPAGLNVSVTLSATDKAGHTVTGAPFNLTGAASQP